MISDDDLLHNAGRICHLAGGFYHGAVVPLREQPPGGQQVGTSWSWADAQRSVGGSVPMAPWLAAPGQRKPTAVGRLHPWPECHTAAAISEHLQWQRTWRLTGQPLATATYWQRKWCPSGRWCLRFWCPATDQRTRLHGVPQHQRSESAGSGTIPIGGTVPVHLHRVGSRI